MSSILSPKRFYVYLLCDPRDATFYVGKGIGGRMHEHEKEAERGCECHKCRKIRKIWRLGGQVHKKIVFRTDDEQEAYDYERHLIDQFGLHNLTNHAPGGDGSRTFLDLEKSICLLSEAEYIAYLKTIHEMTPRLYKKALNKYRTERLAYLVGEWRAMRQRHDPRAEIAAQEIEQLRITLGLVVQERLPFWKRR